jgi:hypothetical protein
MTAAAETIGTSWMLTAAGPPESDSRKVSNSREDSNIQQGHRNSSRNSTLQHQQHPGNKRDARNSRDATNSTSICRDANGTVKTPTTHGVSRKFAKKLSERQKICEERHKNGKNSQFCSDRFRSV